MSTYLLGALLGICLISRPGVATSDEEPVVVISGDLPAVNNVSAGALAQRAVLRAFLRDHPNYVFKPFAMPKIQGHAMDTGPLMGISSGNPPHAIYVNFRQSSSYTNHGFLYPLLVCPDPSMHVLAVWLSEFQQEAPSAAVFASILIVSVPTMTIFLVTQRTIMRGIAVPAEK